MCSPSHIELILIERQEDIEPETVSYFLEINFKI